MTPAFAYLQVRLQAHHSRRLHEADWQRLAMVGHYDLLLKQLRETSLAPWLQTVSETLPVESLEVQLQAGFLQTITEITNHVPQPWRAAVQWTTRLLELPLHLYYLKHGGQEGEPFVGLEPIEPSFWQQKGNNPADLLPRWLETWRTLWPKGGQTARKPLEQLLSLLLDHRAEFAALPGHEEAMAARVALEVKLLAMFRRYACQPVVVFIYLTMMFLDYERLRGALVRHALFHRKELVA